MSTLIDTVTPPLNWALNHAWPLAVLGAACMATGLVMCWRARRAG